MMRVAPYLQLDASADAARQLLAERPSVGAYFEGLSKPSRSKARGRLAAAGYSAEVVDVLAPLRNGPRAPPASEASAWGLLGGPARQAVADALGVADPGRLPEAPEYWTPAAASRAADAIAAHYANPTSAALNLTALRRVLRVVFAAAGAIPEPVRAATLRPDNTTAHNERNDAARAERVARGIEVPPPFERIGDLRARVEAFIAGGDLTAQTAADLLVALSARPGEATRIAVGDRGGVRGVTVAALKKRDPHGLPIFAVAGALGEPLAVRFVDAWQARGIKPRADALRALPALARGWGLQARDLRALGAMLAVRAEALAGNVANDGQARDAHRAALRHEEPGRHRPAAESYARVNDPVARLCAQIAELSTADREAVASLVRQLGSAPRL
jgi:hypothetical protein